MKFLVLFLASAALASASIIGKKNVDIREDGTVVIKGEDGKEIIISKQFGPFGQKDIEIEITAPNAISKKIQINDDNQINIQKVGGYQYLDEEDRIKRSSSLVDSDDIYEQIYQEFQNVVDEASYQKLLSKVQKSVTKGKLSSTVLDYLQALKEESKLNNLIAGQDISEQQVGLGQLWNKLYPAQGIYAQQERVQQLLIDVLTKIFDKQVLVNILNQQQQLIFQRGQSNIIDSILSAQGIFDYNVLIRLVKNPVLRNVLIQEGIFDETVVQQILNTLTTKQVVYIQGAFPQALLEQLINRQVLRNYLVNQGIVSRYILGNIFATTILGSTLYQQGTYQQDLLLQYIQVPVLRNILIQQGIFNKVVLQQLLFALNQQGVVNQALLHQVINKAVLRNALIQYGIVNKAILEQLVSNEVLGLKVLLNVVFVQQTPNVSYYGQLSGFIPRVGQFGGNQYTGYFNTQAYTTPYTSNLFRNVLYGQQGTGVNQGFYNTLQGRQGVYGQGLLY